MEQIISATASLFIYWSKRPRSRKSRVQRFVIGVFPVFGPARRLLHRLFEIIYRKISPFVETIILFISNIMRI